jgi:hypothetical protein
MRAQARQIGRIPSEKGLKKEKQPWQSQRCFPGCVLEVVCLVRRPKYGKVAQIRKILVEERFSVFRRGTREIPVGIQPSVK